MRIAVVTVAGSGVGGMQRHTHDLVHGLRAAGHDVELIAPANREDPNWLARFNEAFLDAHAREPFDVVHSESTSALGLVHHKVHRQVPIVVMFHGNFLMRTMAGISRARKGSPLRREVMDFLWLCRVHFRHGNVWRYFPFEWIVPTPQQVRTQYLSHLLDPRKAHVIPHGVDTEAFRPRTKSSRDRPLLVAVGRLNHEKGFDVAIRALAHIPHADLVVVGDGEERGALERLAVQTGVDQRVRFTGRVSDEEVQARVADADVFLFPTRRNEAMGYVLLEAMSCGIPVVASRIGAIPEIVTSGENGILVPVDDVDTLARLVTNLLSDDAERARIAENARALVLDRYSLAQSTQRKIEVYEIARGERPHPNLRIRAKHQRPRTAGDTETG